MIKAVAAPYTTLRFMPTGGINPENIVPYLQYDKILACGGSWMVKGNLVAEGTADELKNSVNATAFEDAFVKIAEEGK